MGLIYNKARQVIVWLGPASESSTLAVETLRSIGRDVIYDPKLHQSAVVRGSPTYRI
jgi:hypothetical protein